MPVAQPTIAVISFTVQLLTYFMGKLFIIRPIKLLHSTSVLNPNRVDKAAQQLSSKIRNQIYNYLQSQLPFRKELLMNEVKKFAIKKDEEYLKSLERQIQKSIKEIMPKVEMNFKHEAKRIEDSISLNKGGDKSELKMPRKKFPWNDSLK